MTLKKTTISICIFLFAGFLCAQKLDVKWSDLQSYSNKEDGFFSYFIGGNSKNLYAMFSNQTWGTRKQRFKFIAFDSHTMKKVADVTVIDRRKAEEKKKYEGLRYHKTLIFEDILYVFWIKENKEKDELYVQSFDAKLKPVNKLKKVYELNSGKKATKKAEIFVMGNKENSQAIMIGGELSGEKGQNIKVEYKVLKSDFSFGGAGQLTLPATIMGRSDALTSEYEYGDDGNLHIKTRVIIPSDERKNLKKHESYFYTVYSIVDPNTNSIKSLPLKFENKNIFDMGIVANKDAVKIFGFFCDITKDPRGNDTHGIFYCIIDPQTKDLNKMNFTYFTKPQLDKLFAGDNQDRKDRHLIKSKKKKKSEDESLGSMYEIEQVQSLDKDNLTIFCSVMYNYTVRNCDSKGNCTTTYYCQKRNVTAFKIDNNGAIVWASNLDREITYRGWDIKDVNVICPDKKNFYVTYGSSYSKDKTKKNMFSRKSGKHMRDNLEYATFDYNTGNFKKEEYVLNAPKTKKKEKKYIAPTDIQVIDERFYVNSTHIGLKTGWLIGGCVTTLACPPVGYWMLLLNGNARKGNGYLGVVSGGK